MLLRKSYKDGNDFVDKTAQTKKAILLKLIVILRHPSFSIILKMYHREPLHQKDQTDQLRSWIELLFLVCRLRQTESDQKDQNFKT